jgi:hypothetical protein
MESTDLNWRKASYSSNGGGECVEVGEAQRSVVVRDTKDRTGPMLRFTPGAWRRFADKVKRSLASDPPWSRARRGTGRGRSRFGDAPFAMSWFPWLVMQWGCRESARRQVRARGDAVRMRVAGCLSRSSAWRNCRACTCRAAISAVGPACLHLPWSLVRGGTWVLFGEAGLGVWGETWIATRGRTL